MQEKEKIRGSLMSTLDTRPLAIWFKKNKRSFPWRENPTPYSVWISEIMLQQTRASVVIPYFIRWMERFPTPQTLAEASVDEVIKMWEGLGYYSRARNIHTAAQEICEKFDGNLPSDPTALRSLKGLGEYTVGAILSFAFHQKAPAVDGNVIRVISRLFALEEDIAKPKTVAHIRSLTATLLPENEPWIISEALIELGATHCQKSPTCPSCPLKSQCQAFALGKEKELPFKSKKSSTTKLFRSVLIITDGSHILLKKGEKGKVMADLYEFPYLDHLPLEKLLHSAKKMWDLDLTHTRPLPEVTHTFTRYHASLKPHLFQIAKTKKIEGHHWVPLNQLDKLPFSSGHRKIKETLINC